MTLPPITSRQSLLSSDNTHQQPINTTTTTSRQPSIPKSRRTAQCLSWAEPPPPIRTNIKRERRRAICSWSVGYGTLSTETHHPLTPPLLAAVEQQRRRSGVAVDAARRSRHPAANGGVTQNIPVPHAATADIANGDATREDVTASERATASPISTTPREPLLGNGRSSPTNLHKRAKLDFLTMPGLKSLVTRRRNSGSGADTSLPLVKREGSCNALIKPAASLASLRKCETVVALTGVLGRSTSSSTSGSMEPLQPVNRLRVSSSSSANRLCSRCSSLLTLASSSRYSLNTSTGGFVQLPDEPPLLCKLCLSEVPSKRSFCIFGCGCSFCSECMRTYVEIEIAEGAYDISCPDAQCPSQGVLNQDEIRRLVGDDLLAKHNKYRLNREIEIDKTRTWCPQAGCETVCTLCPSQQRCHPQSVHCPTCTLDFCSNCKFEWHQGMTCEENNKQLAKQGKVEEAGIPFDSDLIKCCPMCNVPIEKDEGCAQMMCKRCRHVFCWYCLASLDDDFLLRHYDKGPCKNKLGHSRASVIWHRTQVIGIFAGFGILLLVASPLLLLAAPCIVCCKCRFCNAGTTKLDNEDELP